MSFIWILEQEIDNFNILPVDFFHSNGCDTSRSQMNYLNNQQGEQHI